MKTALLMAAVLLAPLAAQARPLPAGTCAPSALDDGVATQPSAVGPRTVSMTLPSGGADVKAPGAVAVVDLSLAVKPDGSVSRVDVLCDLPKSPRFAAELRQDAAAWRFAPTPRAVADMRLAYRVSLAGEAHTVSVQFLGFQAVS